MDRKIILENHYDGSLNDWLKQVPEDIVDKAINILKINQNEVVERIALKEGDYLEITRKVTFWNDLTMIISVWGKPNETDSKTSLTHIRGYASEINKSLVDALEKLEKLKYDYVFDKGTNTKEFIVADKIRQKSKKENPEKFRNVSSLIVKQEYERSGEWGKYCAFDHEIDETIKNLKQINSYTDQVVKECSDSIKSRGKNKSGNKHHNDLIFQLCSLYKKYTGNNPISWNTGSSSFNPNQFTGTIIPFLQTILPCTYYNQKTTSGALQKKIFRMTKDKKYAHLWNDDKN